MPPSVSQVSTSPCARKFLSLSPAHCGALNSINHPRMAVWSKSKYIVIPLIFVILGHWSLLLHGTCFLPTFVSICFPRIISSITHHFPNPLIGILLKATWTDQGCVITQTDNKLLAASFIYSMCFDFTVLILTAVKLAFPAKASQRSRLMTLIFGDGLIFFIVAFVANLVATVSLPLFLFCFFPAFRFPSFSHPSSSIVAIPLFIRCGLARWLRLLIMPPGGFFSCHRFSCFSISIRSCRSSQTYPQQLLPLCAPLFLPPC